MIGKAGTQGEFDWTGEEVYEMMQMCAYEVGLHVCSKIFLFIVADWTIDRLLPSAIPSSAIFSRKKSGRDSITRMSYFSPFLRGAWPDGYVIS
jgi:hypothetical protein